MPETPTWPALKSEPLSVADFHVEGAIMNLGRSPFSAWGIRHWIFAIR